MNEKMRDEKTDRLFRGILSLKTVEECYDFFDDLCTVSEIREMSRRFLAAKLLNENAVYTDIVERTGLSSATISRVNRCLKYGNDGYLTVLSRLDEADKKENSYTAIASFYENLNSDFDYAGYADFIEKIFARFGKEKISLVLDLACGTGTVTRLLSDAGYDMIGVDASADMLAAARSKSGDGGKILYLNQDMTDFELYGTVGAVVSTLDSVNYLTEDGELDKCFSLVHNYLDPDGLFIFDVNSKYKFENIYADNAYILEGEGVLCAWQNSYSVESGLCDFYLTFFSEDENGSYRRTEEDQCERFYSDSEIKEKLTENGFEIIGSYGSFGFDEVKDSDERIFYVARALK